MVAILAVNLWGDSCNPAEIVALANKHQLKLIFDSAHGMGCDVNKTPLGGFGNMEVFSFNEANIVNATEGGCITTNNDALAAKLRNIRSSYGAGAPVDVVKTSNGRMSEAQAAVALLSLDHLNKHIENNQHQWMLYQKSLTGVSGISLRAPQQVSTSNYQAIICLVDESKFGLTRNALVQLLAKENIRASSGFSSPAYCFTADGHSAEHTDKLVNSNHMYDSIIELPCGGCVKDEDVLLIGALIAAAQRHASDIRTVMEGS